jgi:hypothetical protein
MERQILPRPGATRRNRGLWVAEAEGVDRFTDGLLGQAETDHVRDDHASARRGQGRHEVSVQKAPCQIAVKKNQRVAGAFVDVVDAPIVDALEIRFVWPLFARRSLRSSRCIHGFSPYAKKITAWPLRPGCLIAAPRHLPFTKSKTTTSS